MHGFKDSLHILQIYIVRIDTPINIIGWNLKNRNWVEIRLQLQRFINSQDSKKGDKTLMSTWKSLGLFDITLLLVNCNLTYTNFISIKIDMIAISCTSLLAATKNRVLKCETKNNKQKNKTRWKNSVGVFPPDMSNILCLKASSFFSIWVSTFSITFYNCCIKPLHIFGVNFKVAFYADKYGIFCENIIIIIITSLCHVPSEHSLSIILLSFVVLSKVSLFTSLPISVLGSIYTSALRRLLDFLLC